MHFAAQTHVDNSFGNSIAFTESNVLGTHVLLEAAKEARVKLFIHVSTDEVYGDGLSGVASHEGSVLEPTNPYSASKAGAEYLVKAYHRSFALPTIITRGNNVYGPHQYPEKIIPKFVNQLIRGLPITLHGTGDNTRNYLFVEDVARAFDVILHNGRVGETYNIGGDNVHSNIEVARDILRLLGFVDRAGGSVEEAVKRHVVHVADRPFNDLGYPLDCTRLNAIGWREEMPWEAGLRRTVEWYLRHPSHWSASDVEGALVAHPRRGYLPRQVLAGFQAEDDEGDDGTDPITQLINRGRATSLTAAADSLLSSPTMMAGAGATASGGAGKETGAATTGGSGGGASGDGSGVGGAGVAGNATGITTGTSAAAPLPPIGAGPGPCPCPMLAATPLLSTCLQSLAAVPAPPSTPVLGTAASSSSSSSPSASSSASLPASSSRACSCSFSCPLSTGARPACECTVPGSGSTGRCRGCGCGCGCSSASGSSTACCSSSPPAAQTSDPASGTSHPAGIPDASASASGSQPSPSSSDCSVAAGSATTTSADGTGRG